MNVGLISEDRELLHLCREVLADISHNTWSVSPLSGTSDGKIADLLLWDYIPGQTLPEMAPASFFATPVPRPTAGSG